MIDYHLTDEQGAYVRTVQIDPMAPLPGRGTVAEPPKVAAGKVTVRSGDGWITLEKDKVRETPAPEPVPRAVSGAQAVVALVRAELWDAAVRYVDGSSDPLLTAFLHRAAEWRRESPVLARLADGLALAEAQVDDLFVAAAKVEL